MPCLYSLPHPYVSRHVQKGSHPSQGPVDLLPASFSARA